MPDPLVPGLEPGRRRRGAGPAQTTIAGGLVTVAVAIAYTAGASPELVADVGALGALLPGLVHGLVDAGGVLGVVRSLWHGRR
jgi:hypothetical protein